MDKLVIKRLGFRVMKKLEKMQKLGINTHDFICQAILDYALPQETTKVRVINS